uniref:Beta-lactamase class C-like and penicillin binding proteins (PBPs) superfamily n=1 Tax=uncultured Armatimonadetes bacterium TaxID=157466 RepID=A0A6J4HSV8_9BACT|nr:Beta-lactamase class C-like and penicillin binding proteins (PBPs) superfamily [uncultured Armatimonadetes bacterium]
MPGAQVCALRRGQMFLHAALGTLDGERAVTTDTVYDLASVTKPMATAATLLTLVEQGRLTLAASVPSLLGERAAHLANVTVLHLLTHTSGLPAWKALYRSGTGTDAALAAILRIPMGAPPGTKYEYSCLGFILLQHIIEAVSGTPLDELARTNVFEPLGLTSVTYRPPGELHDRIAPTRSDETVGEGEDAGKHIVGLVHDGNARGVGGVSGNAGLFGTAREVAAFGDAVRQGGACSQRLFGAPTTARVLASQIKPEVGAHTLLFFAQGNGLCPSGDLLSPRAVGHSGFTGTLLTLDPEYDLTVAVLTNRVFSDPTDGSKWLGVRRKFLNALAAALC